MLPKKPHYEMIPGLLFIASVISAMIATASGKTVYDELGTPTFRSEPKNILFGASMGGSSHASWVMRILHELSIRGHNVTYVAPDDHIKFAEPYQTINTVSLGEPFMHKLEIETWTAPRTWDQLNHELGVFTEKYVDTFEHMQSIIAAQNADVLMCDLAFIECIDIANSGKLPSIITALVNVAPGRRNITKTNFRWAQATTMSNSSLTEQLLFVQTLVIDSLTPYIHKNRVLSGDTTSEHMAFSERFYRKFIYPISFQWNMGLALAKYRRTCRSVSSSCGDALLDFRHLSNPLKIVNNFFGVEDARPMGPLVELVGPILNAAHEPLPTAIQEFLNTHQRVVFVAFGQHAAAKPDEMQRTLKELLNILDEGWIDGFLWGIGKAATTALSLSEQNITARARSPSERIYNATDLFDNQHPDIRFLAWAPQFAILSHPSVVTFLSHGGGMSVFETLYTGKRAVIRPFFTDQPGNAFRFEREKLGGYLDMDNKEDTFEPLRRVILDRDGVIQANVNRYQALIHIRAKHAVARAADLVEEALYASNEDGQLPHRIDVARKLAFLKANDYDLYLCLVATLIGFGWIAWIAYSKMKTFFFHKSHKQKHKIKQR